MTDWPAALVAELAARRCVLVIGSGLSATSTNATGHCPPTWSGLIKALASAASTSEAKRRLDELIDAGNYPGAAEELRACADRQSLALEFRRLLLDPKFEPSQAHRDLMSIDQNVVISLNYDKIYDNLCLSLAGDDYMVISNNDAAAFARAIRGPARIILKMHGSVDDADSAVFSSSDYHALRSARDQLFNVLNALFLTRTVLFIGCGFNGDPDVEYILTESGLAVKDGFPHYALIPDTTEDAAAFEAARTKGLNISYIKYPAPSLPTGGRDHSAFAHMLADLKSSVLSQREVDV